ncbi:exonuclease subunit SbcD [Pusillimonas sp. TS35]|uniref:exonuclease SbcCD subunit D C-terminal domain-containing protein n=1 Tax=Paracandidimonas lactea TaxID=2895524 RepID=UPI0013709CFF|nr:exonuclease SbcCD subunit D C-terminal domain-containing protein [Paracandidimonas lactea]MYN11572.1 exonuclease subunit SbcD [Pusillimonas sp. TS35]
MKILHTSDWHLGRALYGRRRYEEFEAFLEWLVGCIEREQIDVLLVAGDVFDTSTPSNRAQALYYRFLCRIARSSCRHVVVIAGNHDSPSFLDAPRELLKALDVHVVGSAAQDPADEVIVLDDAQGGPALIVCAVPYLRDRDIRAAEAGESMEDKERKLTEGIRDHYAAVAASAQARREVLGQALPIVGMGHLFTAGGQTIDGDGVRELYVGTLAHVSGGMFPDCFDYLALGHLHVPQRVGGADTRRYCGSPIPMGFGEAGQQKRVCVVELEGRLDQGVNVAVREIDVPVFQELVRITGDWEGIAARLAALKAAQSHAWVEVFYEGSAVLGDLRDRLDALVAGSAIEILRVRNNRVAALALAQADSAETLDDLNPEEVFQRCLAAHDVPPAQRDALLDSYRAVLASVLEHDARAE